MKNNFKMVVSDLDGTLLNHRGSLSKKTIDTFIHLQEKGIQCVLCTGRPYHSCKKIIEQLQLEKFGGVFIGLNGQLVYDFKANSIVQKDQLSNDDITKIFSYAIDAGAYSMELYDKDEALIIFPKKSHFISAFVSALYGFRSFLHQSKHYQVRFLKELPQNHGSAKVCFLGAPSKIKQIEVALKSHSEYTSFLVNPTWLEVLKKGISKGETLKEVASSRSIALNEIIAFGDGENDCSLLSTVGQSFAVKNAMSKTKEVADEIIGFHYNDAVAKKCREIFNLD